MSKKNVKEQFKKFLEKKEKWLLNKKVKNSFLNNLNNLKDKKKLKEKVKKNKWNFFYFFSFFKKHNIKKQIKNWVNNLKKNFNVAKEKINKWIEKINDDFSKLIDDYINTVKEINKQIQKEEFKKLKDNLKKEKLNQFKIRLKELRTNNKNFEKFKNKIETYFYKYNKDFNKKFLNSIKNKIFLKDQKLINLRKKIFSNTNDLIEKTKTNEKLQQLIWKNKLNLNQKYWIDLNKKLFTNLKQKNYLNLKKELKLKTNKIDFKKIIEDANNWKIKNSVIKWILNEWKQLKELKEQLNQNLNNKKLKLSAKWFEVFIWEKIKNKKKIIFENQNDILKIDKNNIHWKNLTKTNIKENDNINLLKNTNKNKDFKKLFNEINSKINSNEVQKQLNQLRSFWNVSNIYKEKIWLNRDEKLIWQIKNEIKKKKKKLNKLLNMKDSEKEAMWLLEVEDNLKNLFNSLKNLKSFNENKNDKNIKSKNDNIKNNFQEKWIENVKSWELEKVNEKKIFDNDDWLLADLIWKNYKEKIKNRKKSKENLFLNKTLDTLDDITKYKDWAKIIKRWIKTVKNSTWKLWNQIKNTEIYEKWQEQMQKMYVKKIEIERKTKNAVKKISNVWKKIINTFRFVEYTLTDKVESYSYILIFFNLLFILLVLFIWIYFSVIYWFSFFMNFIILIILIIIAITIIKKFINEINLWVKIKEDN